jgi:hypothetical protein
MCLEFFNALFSSYFAWLDLALLGMMGAALAARYLFTPSKTDEPDQPSLGFTCPCYAPPEIQAENNKEKTA